MKILAVTSGKGGVGKTTLTLNIARQASLAGLRTLLVDFDIHNKGATSLFLPRLQASGPSVMSLAVESDGFKLDQAESLAARTEPVPLDEGGKLWLIPASRPAEMVQWAKLVAPNEQIVTFFQRFIRALADRHRVDAVILDCYGGVDTLTVAAAGIADDTIIINEPDVITFSGTLLLYKYLAETFETATRKPRVHFVINRITSRHSFAFLQREYETHLADLAITRSILAYLPYDKAIIETFGDYPFITELLPDGLLKKKIRLMLHRLWGDTWPYFRPGSERETRRIYERTRESLFTDPEWILRTAFTAPLWIVAPALLLLALVSGWGSSLHYRMIAGVYLLALFVSLSVLLFMTVFEPVQISRWLLRQAGYRRRKRRLQARAFRVYNAVTSFAEWGRALIPSLGAGVACLIMVGLLLQLNEKPSMLLDLTLWPREVSGFRPGGYYRGLQLNHRAWIKRGTSFRDANLRSARLPTLLDIDLQHADLSEAQLEFSELTGARLDSATIQDASLYSATLISASMRGTVFRREGYLATSLGGADLQAAVLEHADLTGLRLSQTSLAGANLRGAVMDSVELIGANLYRTDLRGATGLSDDALSYAHASDAILDSLQRRRVRRWNAEPHKAPWLASDWVTPERSQEEEIRFQLGAIFSDTANEGLSLSNRVDAVELLLVDRDSQAWHEADDMLYELEQIPPDSTIPSRHRGQTKMLRLLWSVVRDQPTGQPAQDWCQWVDQSLRDEGIFWSWEMWNKNVPAYAYDAATNVRLRAIQLSSIGMIRGERLCRDFFPEAPAVNQR